MRNKVVTKCTDLRKPCQIKVCNGRIAVKIGEKRSLGEFLLVSREIPLYEKFLSDFKMKVSYWNTRRSIHGIKKCELTGQRVCVKIC